MKIGTGIGIEFNRIASDGPYVTSVTIAGVQIVSQILTASYVGGGGSPTYQWKRGGFSIGGATASTYTLVAADSGQNITCTVSIGAAATSVSNVLSILTTVLDEYPNPAIAVSFNKLLRGAEYANTCFNSRRADNVTGSYGWLSSGISNTAQMATNAGGQNMFLPKIFDQSGNNRHLVYSNAAYQFQIANAGALITEGGSPLMKGVAAGSWLLLESGTLGLSDYTIIVKSKTINAMRIGAAYYENSGSASVGLTSGVIYNNFPSIPMNTAVVKTIAISVGNGRTEGKLYDNTGLLSSITGTNIKLFGDNGTAIFTDFYGNPLQGYIETLIVYPTTLNATQIADIISKI